MQDLGEDARPRGGGGLRVLLVQSWLGRREPPVMPLGPGALASVLGGSDVRVIDPNVASSPLGLLESSLRDFQPGIVGFSLRNVDTTQYADRWSYIPAFLEQVALTRRVSPSAFVTAGGPGLSLFPHAVSGMAGLDAALVGEAEDLLPGLLERLEAGDTPVPGAILRARSPACPSPPRYELLGLESYVPWQRNLAVGVEVSRGCSSRCSYCSYPLLGGGSERYRPARAVVSDLEKLHGDYGVRHVFLVSPVLNGNPQMAAEILTAISERNLSLTWEGYFSPEGLTRELALLAARAGCRGIGLSPDSGSSRAMGRLGKGYGPKDVSKALRALEHAPGIRVSLNLFPVVPEGTLLETAATYSRGALWSLMLGRRLSRIRYGTVRLVPGTPLAGTATEESLLEPAFFHGAGRRSPSIPVRLLSRALGRRRS